MPLTFSARSHPGLRRAANEDCYVARPDLGLFAVADGLGGHAAGQVASRMAIEAIEAVVAGTLPPEEQARQGLEGAAGDRLSALVEGFRLGNRRIGLESEASAKLAGMGTTLAAVLLDRVERRPGSVHEATTSERRLEGPGHPAGGGAGARVGEQPETETGEAGAEAIVAHVGDSRVYLWSGGRLVRLTKDHSWVEEQVRRGDMTLAEARQHPWRSLITRALSGGEGLMVDVDRVALGRGDRLIVCSDGLSSVVSDEHIARLLAAEPDDEEACVRLLDAAIEAGGPDNITVIVLTI
ncbi:MAG: PP2C family serine/threonine-protein phosphatase [Vicinamibacterales bacterium]